MKLSYDNTTNEFSLTLSGDELSQIRYALDNEVERQKSNIIYARNTQATQDYIHPHSIYTNEDVQRLENDLKTFSKLSEELEAITQKWVHGN